ncbi:Flp pilus assembly complex ATPase component TadA [Shewanella sp. BF02_Schw]|uniref:type IV pilus twitching motility protein PilT n=1 Tax=Shewanella sp. BF02_Schw TaxID=394908 RepID=UPI001781FC8B|nr:ATPase, T2SS/T4P/T4SS family [Shewanella sp. BF02_Schw]MBO1897653.1 Flp pilus assembly complex ATPase component TadA [Shewanella sp. BF02_Schw]
MSKKLDRSVYALPIVNVYGPEDIQKILLHLESVGGFSDVVFLTDREITVKVDGIPFQITTKKLTLTEVEGFLSFITRDKSASMSVYSGVEVDEAVSIPGQDRGQFYRYRINASAFSVPYRGRGIAITLRSISSETPLPKDIGLDESIAEALMPRQGLVLIGGETGSGKSTTLAASIRFRAQNEDPDSGLFILTYEAPVEYVHDYKCVNGTLIIQASVDEIRGDTKSFESGLRNALRRSPEVIVVGEIRDLVTVDIAIKAAESGHLCLGTVHVNKVSGAFTRIADYYPSDVQKSKVLQLISSVKAILVQYLAQRVGGGRIAVQEYLPLTTEVRLEIMTRIKDEGMQNVSVIIDEAVDKYGFSMLTSANRLLDSNKISQIEFLKVESGI